MNLETQAADGIVGRSSIFALIRPPAAEDNRLRTAKDKRPQAAEYKQPQAAKKRINERIQDTYGRIDLGGDTAPVPFMR